MEIKSNLKGNTLTIYLEGELDHFAASRLRNAIDNLLLDSCAKSVVFDMSHLEFMDSTGIGLLIGRYKMMSAEGVECFIKNPRPSVAKILNLSGIFSIIKLI